MTWRTDVGSLRKNFVVGEGRDEYSHGPPFWVRFAKSPPPGVTSYSPEYERWSSDQPDVEAAIAWLVATLNTDWAVRKVRGLS